MRSRICAAATVFLMASFLLESHGYTAAKFVDDFKALRSAYDLNGMTDIVREHRSEIPEQVRLLMDEAFAVDMPKAQRSKSMAITGRSTNLPRSLLDEWRY